MTVLSLDSPKKFKTYLFLFLTLLNSAQRSGTSNFQKPSTDSEAKTRGPEPDQ